MAYPSDRMTKGAAAGRAAATTFDYNWQVGEALSDLALIAAMCEAEFAKLRAMYRPAGGE